MIHKHIQQKCKLPKTEGTFHRNKTNSNRSNLLT
jgi:hypothetical protein